MNKFKIIVDMDEVLVDLSEGVRQRVNKDFNKNFPVDFNKSYWWEDYGVERNYFQDLLDEENFFYDIIPVEGAVETLTKLHEEGYDIHILTFPQHNRFCFYDKIRWIKKYLPFINIETNFHTSGNKGMFATKDRILIDDNEKYLFQFQNNGGIPIAFRDYNWNKNFKGLRVMDWKGVYNIIHKLQDFKDNPNRYSKEWKLEYESDFKPDSGIDVNKFREYMRRGIY